MSGSGWRRTSRYAWTNEAGYVISAARVPERCDMPDNARRAEPEHPSYYEQLVPLYWCYTLWSPHTQRLVTSFDPGELREHAAAAERARAIGGNE